MDNKLAKQERLIQLFIIFVYITAPGEATDLWIYFKLGDKDATLFITTVKNSITSLVIYQETNCQLILIKL